MPKDLREKTVCDICGENSSSGFMSMTNTIGRKLNICRKCSIKEGFTVESEEEILSSIKLMPPQQIVEELDKRVVSHSEAKVTLSICIYSHLLRIKKKHKLKSMEKQIKKSNLLLTGVSGCGKTFLAQNIASIVNVPFTVYPVSSLSQPGYVGDDPENILLDLIRNSDYNIKRAEKGIIFLDEIDKISRKSGKNPSITRDVSGEGIQSFLLPILEGTNCTVPINGGRKHPQGTNYTINTSEILFLGGGAFEGIENLVESKLHQNDKRPQIGFGVNGFKRSNYTIRELRNNITIDDLQNYGMMPELLGRFTNISHLLPLEVSDLVSILKLPNGIIDEFKSYFYLHDKELTIEEDALYEIAAMAISHSTGARGIRTILNEVLENIMFNSPTEPHTTHYSIDRDFIKRVNPGKTQMAI